MDELGNILREAREMKGLTLGDVQDEIRINTHYLEALEAGDYAALPTPVHARGFLRNYARFLDLDPAPLLERYNARAPQGYVGPQAESSAHLGPRQGQPFFNPVNVDLSGNPVAGPERTVRLVIVAALLITIGLAATRFVPLLRGEGDGRDALPAMIESLLATETPTPEGGDGDAVMPAVTSQPILPTERNNPDAVDTTPLAPAVQPELPATMETIHLRLDITERTWIRVTIDGEVVFEDQVVEEDGPLEWDAEQSAELLTGNAAGVFVSINDVELGRLGGRGEVGQGSWQTTSN